MIDKNDSALLSVAKSLSIPSEWLFNIINFESRWNPQATAKIPFNKTKVDKGTDYPRFARGLIQFIDSTAQSLGYLNADDLVNKNPTVKEQLLFPVLQYLKQYSPFPSEQSFYLSVSYPAARNWPPSKEFPDSVKSANPGISTPQDYINKVKGVTVINTLIMVGGGVVIYLAAKYFKLF